VIRRFGGPGMHGVGGIPFAAMGGGIGQGAANGLLNNLIAYWPGDEASGNLLDAHTNGLDLTDVNTVTSNPGHVYSTARQYTRASAEYHSHADDPLLRLGADSDFTCMAWVYLDSKPTNARIIEKRSGVGDETSEYSVFYRNSDDKFCGRIGDGANADLVVSASSPNLSTWYMVLFWHDATDDVIRMQIDDGSVAETAWTHGTQSAAGIFTISRAAWQNSLFFDGRIGPTAFWKSAAGGGGALAAEQRAALWNGGAGLKYSEFTS